MLDTRAVTGSTPFWLSRKADDGQASHSHGKLAVRQPKPGSAPPRALGDASLLLGQTAIDLPQCGLGPVESL
jgi:hypothetical protein